MAARSERGEAGQQASERKGRKKSTTKKSGGAHPLASAVASAASADAMLDLIERLGLVDVILGRIKSRIEEADLDEVFDEVADYMRRNPEVLVISLGAMTAAAALIVWLNNRREWDGTERRTYESARRT